MKPTRKPAHSQVMNEPSPSAHGAIGVTPPGGTRSPSSAKNIGVTPPMTGGGISTKKENR